MDDGGEEQFQSVLPIVERALCVKKTRKKHLLWLPYLHTIITRQREREREVWQSLLLIHHRQPGLTTLHLSICITSFILFTYISSFFSSPLFSFHADKHDDHMMMLLLLVCCLWWCCCRLHNSYIHFDASRIWTTCKKRINAIESWMKGNWEKTSAIVCN
jgi:hypothetical protein